MDTAAVGGRGRPVLFSGPMVRAILGGRKSVTRRVLAPGDHTLVPNVEALCPYGQADGRLWVRETWAADRAYDSVKPRDIPVGAAIWYHADDHATGTMIRGRGRPSIFLLPWASRISLEVTEVRVERLQEITEADAIAEGVEDTGLVREHFASLWNEINEARGYGWDANPWVWVIRFHRLPTTSVSAEV